MIKVYSKSGFKSSWREAPSIKKTNKQTNKQTTTTTTCNIAVTENQAKRGVRYVSFVLKDFQIWISTFNMIKMLFTKNIDFSQDCTKFDILTKSAFLPYRFYGMNIANFSDDLLLFFPGVGHTLDREYFKDMNQLCF